eukprot:433747-Pleurochrysis_carterae.AAC.2
MMFVGCDELVFNLDAHYARAESRRRGICITYYFFPLLNGGDQNSNTLPAHVKATRQIKKLIRQQTRLHVNNNFRGRAGSGA